MVNELIYITTLELGKNHQEIRGPQGAYYHTYVGVKMREELTNEELIQLYEVVTGSVNAQFELWLTITFAVIIASYIAGHRLAKSLQYLIAILYTSVSVLLYLMLVGAVQFSAQFDALKAGTLTEEGLFVAIVLLRTSVWILGTIATIVFVFKGHKDDTSGDA
jgi:hypothetical protein